MNPAKSRRTMDRQSLFAPQQQHCTRAAVLIDAAAYFDALASVILEARRSVLIVGWDIRSDVVLRPREEGPARCELSQLLSKVTAERPDLHVNILGWDFASIYAAEREFLPGLRFLARTGARVHFHLAADHAMGASHHQKLVVVDDAVAFVGGIDLSSARWDEPGHESDAPYRRLPSGEPYGPFHDIQLCVAGPAAAALGDLARARYKHATGDRLPKPEVTEGLWPAGVEVDFEDIHIDLVQTHAAYGEQAAAHDVERTYLAAIESARFYLYFENQYVTSTRITEALCRSLAAPVGPEVIIVTPLQQSGRLEQATMGFLRARRVRELQRADRCQRLRVLCPVVGPEAQPVNVHSKILIADDRLLRVGSANLSNRSMRLDTECDAVLELEPPAHRRTIRGLRDRLLAEHLHVPQADFATEVQQRGSLIASIEALAGNPEGTLVPLDPSLARDEGLAALSDNADLIDSTRPLDEAVAEQVFAGSRGPIGQVAQRIPMQVIAAVVVAAVGALWLWSPLGEVARPERLAAGLRFLRSEPFGLPLATVLFALASAVMVPVTVLIVAMALVFGPWSSFLAALVGSLAGAMISYGVGRFAFRDWLQTHQGGLMKRLGGQLKRRGTMAMAAVRVVPIAPFTLINLVAGASSIRLRDFVLGTIVGMGPGIFALCVASGPVAQAIRDPNPLTIVLACAIIVGAIVLGQRLRVVVERLAQRLRAQPEEAGS